MYQSSSSHYHNSRLSHPARNAGKICAFKRLMKITVGGGVGGCRTMVSRRLVVGLLAVVCLVVLYIHQSGLRVWLLGTGRACRGYQEMAQVCPPGPASNEDMDNLASSTGECRTCIPCIHPEEYDLRIIVLTYDRPTSLSKVLNSLNGLLLDGDKAAIDIWVDRSTTGDVPTKTVELARSFKWQHGPVRFHIQQSHAGLHGQWIDSWRPRANSRELALILEDDVDLSPCAYRWLKAAHRRFRNDTDIAGYSLYEGAIVHMPKLPPHKLLLHRRFGTQGFSPLPSQWRSFQTWYHRQQANETFAPYVANDPLVTSWYRNFELGCATGKMWSIWFIHFADIHGLYTVYPNLASYMSLKNLFYQPKQYLAFHRQESGLHFHAEESRSSDSRLIRDLNCKRDYTDMVPQVAARYHYDGHLEVGSGASEDRRWTGLIILLLIIHIC